MSGRPLLAVLAAFAAGAALAVAATLLIVNLQDEDEEGPRARATTTAAATTPGATPTRAAPTATPPDPRSAEGALIAYLRDQRGEAYIGACSETLPPGGTPLTGLCAEQLYESDELVTFLIGPPSSEAIGEAVLTRNEDGSWTVTFVPAPVLGEPLTVGAQAVVFGAGDCLTFRAAPTVTGQPLSCQLDGTRGLVVGGPVQADNITWWQLQDLGWASAEFLGVVR